MRLIDADELKRQIENALKKQKARGCDLVKVSELPILIDRQKTAYDVDKVVERLELLSENEEYNDLNTCEEKAVYNTAYLNAIEIVKACGIDG